jgi:hypothetical protein
LKISRKKTLILSALLTLFIFFVSPLLIPSSKQPRLEISLVSAPKPVTTPKVFSFWNGFGHIIVTQTFHTAKIRFQNSGQGQILFTHRWAYLLDIKDSNSTNWLTVDPPILFASFEPISPGRAQSFDVLIPDNATEFRLKCSYRRSQPGFELLDRISSSLNARVFLGDLKQYQTQSRTWKLDSPAGKTPHP